jgi:hypothetical protein
MMTIMAECRDDACTGVACCSCIFLFGDTNIVRSWGGQGSDSSFICFYIAPHWWVWELPFV